MAVALHDAKTGQSETLTCTPEHPFFVPGQGWVEAGSLETGKEILRKAVLLTASFADAIVRARKTSSVMEADA